MADMKILYDEVISRANEVVKAMNERESQSKIKSLRKVVKGAIDDYNNAIAEDYYKTLAADFGHDAVRHALEAEGVLIPGTISVSFKETKDGVAYMAPGTAHIKVNLVRMEQVIGKEYFHDEGWFYRLSVLARMIAVSLNNDLDGSVTFVYPVDKACEAFDIGADASPTSKSSMVKAFQRVIDDVVFIGDNVDKNGNPVNALKFTTKNWAYVRECMTRKGAEVGEVAIASPTMVSDLIGDCIHLMLKNKGNRLSALGDG